MYLLYHMNIYTEYFLLRLGLGNKCHLWLKQIKLITGNTYILKLDLSI